MRNLAITAAIAALSFGASAAASPFSLSASYEIDTGEKKRESRGFIQTVLNSTTNAFGLVFTAGEKHEEDLVLRFYKKSEGCEDEQTADGETDAEADEKKTPAGPEPIYFGF